MAKVNVVGVESLIREATLVKPPPAIELESTAKRPCMPVTYAFGGFLAIHLVLIRLGCGNESVGGSI